MIRLNHRRKLAIATYNAPREANIYGKLSIDASQALAYIEHLRETTGERVTITHLVGRAVAEGLKHAPTLNGRLVGPFHLANPNVAISFLVAIADQEDLAKVKVDDADRKSVVEIASELNRRAELVRSQKDPDFESGKRLLRLLPIWLIRPIAEVTGLLTSGLGISARPLGLEALPFGACVITSVGMFGVDEGYVPPTPWARVPSWVLIGAIREQAVVRDGKIIVRPMLTITATIDHRFIDGLQGANLTKVVRDVLENPWKLEGLESPPSGV